jgi:hypothetical protein
MIIIQEVIHMDRISRKHSIKGLSKIDRDIETIESLNDLIILYKQDIKIRLNKITSDNVVQEYIKSEIGIL